MLKNWTITFKSIKNSKGGFLGYLKYLNDNQHRNHKENDNHKIINFNDDYRKIYVENKRILDTFNYKKILENKGGRPSKSLGVSVVVSFPYLFNNYDLLNNFKEKLIKQYYIDLCKLNNLEYDKNSYLKYRKLVYCNCHLKDKGSKTQFNLTLPHYLPYKKILTNYKKGVFSDTQEKSIIDIKKIDMTQKKYSYLLKKINNKLSFNILNIDINDYEVKSKMQNKKKQKIGIYKVNQQIQQKQQQLKKLDEKVSILTLEKEKIKTIEINLYNKVQKLKENIEMFEKEKIDDKTLKTYIERINKKIIENDFQGVKKDMSKIENRIVKVKKYHNIDF